MMKKQIISTILLLCCALVGHAREVISLNNNWSFVLDHQINISPMVPVSLPHTWNIDALIGKKDYYRGIGNYVKDVYIPAKWMDKRIFIRFLGANSQANLMINGRYVGEHLGGYTAFTFEITKFLKFGSQNNLWVTVSNVAQRDYMPLSADHTTYGGLYRGVELIVLPQNHISVTDYSSDGVYLVQENISERRAEIKAVVKMNIKKNNDNALNVSVYSATDEQVFTSGAVKVTASDGHTTTANVPIAFDNPHLWNGLRDGYLYRVEVDLLENGVRKDRVVVPMGVRYFAIDSRNGFSLNGRPYKIKGVTRTNDYASIGSALRKENDTEDIGLILEMGANGVRMKNSPHSADFFDLCDQHGLIVWSDLPFSGPTNAANISYINKPAFRENGKNQLREMIRQNYNHPSVIFWGIFSNLDRRGEDPLAYIKELNELAHVEDPTRFTAAASNKDGEINLVTDVIGWNHSFGWSYGVTSDLGLWLTQLQKYWPNLKSGLSEYGAEGNIYHQEDSLIKSQRRDVWHPERWQTHFHEEHLKTLESQNNLWGSFACSAFDFGASFRDTGDCRGVNESGFITFDRKTKKDVFYLYKANWNRIDPFLHIAEQRWIRESTLRNKIKIFSNQQEVELVVNGHSLGYKPGENGTFTWETSLNEGENQIVARSGRLYETASIFVNSNNRR